MRQGNPLSPYLFVLAMEALSFLLKRGLEGGSLFQALRWEGKGRERVEVSHLLFADDILIFCEACKDQLLHLH